MESEYDVVVIGAGAFGLSAGLHLARLGLRVSVVDRFRPASQTSPRAAGLFKRIQRDRAQSDLARLSNLKVRTFAGEFETPLPIVASGSLFIARTVAHAGALRQEAEQAAAWGVELERVDAPEAHRLAPFLETRGIVAAYHTPDDLYIEEPSSLLEAYMAAGRRLGLEVWGGSPVDGIDVAGGEVRGVVIGERTIRTPTVIDAAGAWAPAVARLAGAGVTVQPMRHQLLITQPVAGVDATHPMVRVVDAAAYVRPARGGLMMGGFETDPLVLEPDQQRGFSVDRMTLDVDVLHRFEPDMERSVPALEAPLAEVRGGLVTMTPDGRLLVGPVPGVRGLWTCTGCNASGFSLSPGVGQVLAEWIVDGAPSIDLGTLDPGRFGDLPDAEIRSRATWQYAHYYG
ncbi:MAG: NAD(P)/FAD-dependent oxidoreductase [Candidatus Dormibacteraceae bacterium]